MLETIFPTLPCEAINPANWTDAVAIRNGVVYLAVVEKGSPPYTDTSGDTVVYQGSPISTGWSWLKTVITHDTVKDNHHGASIGIDDLGYIHVACNMHHMPWQYWRSDQPHSIQSFSFHGTPVTQAQLDLALNNETDSFDSGSAAIPGNQITYPNFFNLGDGSLAVIYRQAKRPNAPWENRDFCAGLAEYDSTTQTWQARGVSETLDAGDTSNGAGSVTTLIRNEDHVPYQLRAVTAPDGTTHGQFVWSPGIVSQGGIQPAHWRSSDLLTFTDNTGEYLLPMRMGASEMVVDADHSDWFTHDGMLGTDNLDEPYMVLLRKAGGAILVRSIAGVWQEPEDIPYSPSKVFFLSDGSTVGFGTRGRVIWRAAGGVSWESLEDDIASGIIWGYPSVGRDGDKFYLLQLSITDELFRVMTWEQAA